MNTVLAGGALLLAIAFVVGIGLQYAAASNMRAAQISALLREWGLPLAFMLALAGSALTLFYSEIVGYPPCSLCWLQRIFLYPQVILLGLALWWQDRGIGRYLVWLSLLGVLVALYHYYYQMTGGQGLACLGDGATSGCARRYVYEFGFMTMPLMSAIVFAALAGLAKLSYRDRGYCTCDDAS